MDCERVDQFDRLPDCLVLIILNMVGDVRSLGCLCAVAKRFNVLVPLVQDICVKIDRVVIANGDSYETVFPYSPKPRNLFSRLLKPMFSTLLRPFRLLLGNAKKGSKPFLPLLSDHTPTQVLKNFTQIKNLVVEFPVDGVGIRKGDIVIWGAEFGSSLQNFVILGGSLVDRAHSVADQEPSAEDNVEISEDFVTNGELERRLIWTFCSLFTALLRHHLFYPTIKDHPTLSSLVLTDTDGQGTLTMGMEQLKEFREMPVAASMVWAQIQESTLELKFAPNVEFLEGMALQGATLMTVEASIEGSSGNSSSSLEEAKAFVGRTFNGPFKLAVKALMKQPSTCDKIVSIFEN